MTSLPAHFVEHDGLLCFPDHDNPALWHFVPAGPVPVAAPMLQAVGTRTQLMLSARWLATDAHATATLMDAIREHAGVAQEVVLQPVGPQLLELDAMQLYLAGPDSAPPLATSKTAGYAPWDAVFSAALQPGAVPLVREALEQGRGGRLRLTVRFALRLPLTVRAQLRGQVAAAPLPLLQALGGRDPLDAAQELIDAALRSGELRLQVETALEPQEALVQATREQVLVQARMLVAQDLALQAEQYRQACAQPPKPDKAGGDWLARLLERKPQKPHPSAQDSPKPAFASRPITLATESCETQVFRFPRPDADDAWLTASTDLGDWAALSLPVKGA